MGSIIFLEDGLPNSGLGWRHRFLVQRTSAAVRGIVWDLSFNNWMEIWRESGHLAQRGRGDGKYCMARFGDTGPYSVGNVYITTHNQNSKDMLQFGCQTPEARANLSMAMKGVKKSPEHRANLSRALKGNPKVGSWLGKHLSPEHRAKISATKIARRSVVKA
jgi:hypothetical protein